MKTYKKVSLLILILALASLSLGANGCPWIDKNEETIAGSSAPLPSAVSNLTAGTVSHTQIALSWEDNSNNEESVKIERKTGAEGTYAEIGSVGANVTSYSDTGLIDNTTYYYRIRAYNANGYSMYSNEVSATTPKFHVGSYNSIAVDSNNKVHISYHDDSSQALKYATNVSDSWVTSTIDSNGDTGNYTSIAVTGTGTTQVHISYSNAGLGNAGFKYATNVSGSWVTSVVDTPSDDGLIRNTSIAIDTNNRPHVAYIVSANTILTYAENITGTWVTTTLMEQGTGYPGIALDTNNNVYISFGNQSPGDLKYVTNSTGTWVVSVIDNFPGMPNTIVSSIAADKNNKLHIAYSNYVNGYGYDKNLKYATDASGSWVISELENAGVVRFGLTGSIAVDTNGKVHISYIAYTSEEVRYITNVSGTWVTTVIGQLTSPTDSAISNRDRTSIALDSNNKVHISYSGDINYDLKYATNASGSWVISMIDE